MGIYACFGDYLCICSGSNRGGAPPVMDGIFPGIGPDVDLCVSCHVLFDAPGLFVY